MENKENKIDLKKLLIYKKHMELQQDVMWTENFYGENYTEESVNKYINEEMVKYIKEMKDEK